MSAKPPARRPSVAPGAGRRQPSGSGASPATTKPAVKTPRLTSWSAEAWLQGVTQTLARLHEAGAVSLDADAVAAPLARYMGLLAHWNATFNLTALRDPQDMLSHHLADCLAVIPPLQRHLDTLPAGQPVRLLDVGSGGGLPGAVLAICCPRLQVSCVDTVGKKAAFIRQVAAELQLPNLKGEHARVEAMRTQHDIVTCRAFAALPDFVTWSRDRVAPGGIWLAMKGKQPDDEIAALPDFTAVFHVEQVQVPGLDAERCLVWMRPQG